jgi:hypothetical protein
MYSTLNWVTSFPVNFLCWPFWCFIWFIQVSHPFTTTCFVSSIIVCYKKIIDLLEKVFCNLFYVPFDSSSVCFVLLAFLPLDFSVYELPGVLAVKAVFCLTFGLTLQL